MVDVPAVKVKFVDVVNESGVDAPSVIVLPFKLIERILLLFEDKLRAVRL
jgi:hypothetical protein